MRVISSPSSSTTLPITFILLNFSPDKPAPHALISRSKPIG